MMSVASDGPSPSCHTTEMRPGLASLGRTTVAMCTLASLSTARACPGITVSQTSGRIRTQPADIASINATGCRQRIDRTVNLDRPDRSRGMPPRGITRRKAHSMEF